MVGNQGQGPSPAEGRMPDRTFGSVPIQRPQVTRGVIMLTDELPRELAGVDFDACTFVGPGILELGEGTHIRAMAGYHLRSTRDTLWLEQQLERALHLGTRATGPEGRVYRLSDVNLTRVGLINVGLIVPAPFRGPLLEMARHADRRLQENRRLPAAINAPELPNPGLYRMDPTLLAQLHAHGSETRH